LIGNFVASDWQKASNYDNTKSILDGGITTDGTLVVAKGGTVAAGLTAYDSGDNNVRIWAGATLANRATAPFRVTQGGYLYASNANISGTITSNNVNITGGNIQLHGTTNTSMKIYHDNYPNQVYTYYGFNTIQSRNDTISNVLSACGWGPSLYNYRSNSDLSIYTGTTLANGTGYEGKIEPGLLVAQRISTNFSESTMDPDKVTTPKIVAGNIDCGTCTLNTVNDTTVPFNKTFSSPPIVILTCKANNTGTNVYSGSVIATTTTNFTAFSMVNVSTNKNIPFNWIAIGT
jgi:hypothetical protein